MSYGKSRILLFLIGLIGFLPLSGQELDTDLLKNWKARSIGPAGMSGRVTTIDVLRDDPSVIYAGTASGGLWKSESGGINWKPLFDEEIVASIGALAIAPSNPDVIWVGTGEGNPRNSQTSGFGVYRSLDGGDSWEPMGLENTRNIHRVIIHPTDPNTVWIGAQGSAWGDHPERGVYKTTDGGKSWRKVLYVDEGTGIADLVQDPQNPNKLFAAMWQFRRWPWYFNSGGEGSGLYVSHDGGESWTERTEADGLPKGDLGRIGLAIAPSDPKIVYAIVEAKKNGLYRSTDGGKKWKLVNDKGEIGNRPFYYSDIFVDPSNENRIYSLYSMVSMSEDGGKSFRIIIPYSGVHPDHHAWYMHPDNPDFIINGNDGGLNISFDRGKSWRFAENLPLAQFYHINIDNEIPYNVYGGMQDNGSWRGPAYVWRSGGIRNAYWEELFFGDGFDVVPDPEDNRYGYAMSQGGSVGRYDLETRSAKMIMPTHPDGEELRFNWNAAIAQDPFDAATIYYGSQYVHKSTDHGDHWEIISPDLTTNDPEKQKQSESGGLTTDDTNAENHTSIVSIAPSPKKENVIWVGSDDGRLHVTQDGGENWTDLTSKMAGLPAGSWIPQIHPSDHEPGEAFIVANNYRRNDWTPFVYYTADYGKTVRRLVGNGDVWGYCLSIVQDPVEENLLFLGTEFGLYFSLDKGRNWHQWEHGYPTASTMDLKIHPREHDLIIGTFGRAAFVLDNIQPLRVMAKEGAEVLNAAVKAYPVSDAYLAHTGQASGTRFAADAIFSGKNRPWGALIPYSVNPAAGVDSIKSDTVTAMIYNQADELIRTLKTVPDTGMNVMIWRLREKGVRYFTREPRPNSPEPGGAYVMPGTYKVKLSYKGNESETSVVVHFDPRVEISTEDIEAYRAMLAKGQEMVGEAGEMMARIRKAKESIKLVNQTLPEGDDEAIAELKKMGKAMQDSISNLENMFRPKPGGKGYTSDATTLSSKLGPLQWGLGIPEPGGPNQMLDRALEQAQKRFGEVKAAYNDFFENDWKAYREAVEKVELSPFKE
ncbi:MAG: hypothetical protein AAFQ68_10725 [Bacteroidota bacterium]